MTLSLWKPNAALRRRQETSVPANRTLFDEMDRVFDRLFEDFALPPLGWSEGTPFASAADVIENENGYELRMDVPGLSSKDLQVKLEGDTLSVIAERKHESENETGSWLRSERTYGHLHRAFTLPGIDPDKVEASCENGVLTVRLPKREEMRPKAITVQVK